MSDLLQQRNWSLLNRTPYRLASFVEDAVDLHTRMVDVCPQGCLAFAGTLREATACNACGQPRFHPDKRPAKQMVRWSLITWLRMMLATPGLGPGMVADLRDARQAAREPTVSAVEDWHSSDNFRGSVRRDFFPSDVAASLRASTDGY